MMFVVDNNLNYNKPFSDYESMLVSRFIGIAAFNLADFCNIFSLCDKTITEGEMTGLRGNIPFFLERDNYDVVEVYNFILKSLRIDICEVSNRLLNYSDKDL